MSEYTSIQASLGELITINPTVSLVLSCATKYKPQMIELDKLPDAGQLPNLIWLDFSQIWLTCHKYHHS